MNTECEPVIILFDPVFLVRDRDTEWGGGLSVRCTITQSTCVTQRQDSKSTNALIRLPSTFAQLILSNQFFNMVFI